MRLPVRVVPLLCFPLFLADGLAAQLISPRALPVSQAEQFDIHPSQNSGMAGVSLALADTLLDAFANPAKGARWRVTSMFSAPAIYSVSRRSGGGRTIPVGLMATLGRWFGGAAVALQEIDAARPPDFVTPDILLPQPGSGVAPGVPEQKNGNALGELMLGRRLGGGLSVAGSVQWSRLHALDGVDVLYDGSASVDQNGGTLDARLGLLLERAGSSYEAVVVVNRRRLENSVHYLDAVFDPATQSITVVPRTVDDVDHARTIGLHLAHARPLTGAWSIGWAATANRISRPAVPGYTLMSLPSDPGNMTAFNFGMGVARQGRGETFGADVMFEPATARYASDVAASRYSFRTVLFRMGFSADLDRRENGERGASIQLGLMARQLNYRLDELHLATGATTSRAESWTEWTPTWGLGFGFSSIDIRYRGQVMHGSARPQAIPGPFGCAVCVAVEPSSFSTRSLPANLEPVRVVMHHITLSIPLR